MTRSLATDVLFVAFAIGAVVAAWRVFRTDSMVRAAYFLLGSFAGVAAILVLLGAPFLGLVIVLMMGGEMTIMAVFMVMFMMNPAGLNPMNMVHQPRAALGAGIASFAGLSAVALTADFPNRAVARVVDPTAQLGRELLGGSMLVFQTAGFTLLATMIGAIAMAARHGRFGDAYDSSLPPPLDGDPAPVTPAAAASGTGADDSDESATEHADHGGHDHGSGSA